ncbi:MAG: hypothetical protein KatS3mg092_0939 [Patescibacteria group bacterium]|nr:MAG: hypothetical protein KatS3mg092_0939 [Patescibacteria group bacterium]
MNNLILIDGNAIMHRAFHAYPLLTSSDNTPTNVIYGFLAMLYKTVVDFKPTHLAVVFDTPKPTFRNKLYEKYQIQRPKIDDKFAVQIPLVKQAIDEASIYRLEKDGYEADDIIGTICEIFKNNQDYKIIIVSGDKDIFQLVNDKTFVATPIAGLSTVKIYNETEIKQKLDILPSQVVDYKALVGDPSDNYPGAKGIGPINAAKLIQKFGSIDNIYKNLDKIESEKIKNILICEKENVYLSKKLATIIKDAPIEIDINKLKFNGFNKKLKDFLEKYEIFSLVKRIFGEKKEEKKPEKKQDQISLF